MTPRIDYTNKDFESLRAELLDLARERLPEWTDQSANDPGVVLVELMAYLGDILLYYQDRIANESYLETALERRSLINLLRLIGYELRPPRPASADLTLLFESDASGTVTIPTGSAFRTAADAAGVSLEFRYRRPTLEIAMSTLSRERFTHASGGDDKEYLFYRTLPVEQVEDVVPTSDPEVIGSSDGTAGQRFSLRRMPLIDDSLTIVVEQNGLLEEWARRETWLDSHSNDADYVVKRDDQGVAWVEFGDGKYGRIPSRGHDNVTAAYEIGGGSKGNVAARAICKFDEINHLKKVFNEVAASGGADAESAAEAVLRGPQLFRARSRAVTAEDYMAYAREFGVGKVRAQRGSWNRVELIIAPVGGGIPSDTLKQDLKAFLETKRMVTSIVEVRDPTYVTVFVDGELKIEPHVFPEQIYSAVDNALADLLAFDNVEFGTPLYLSRVYERIQSLPGVTSVNITRFSTSDSDSDLPIKGQLEFTPDQLPQAGQRSWWYDSQSRTWQWTTQALVS